MKGVIYMTEQIKNRIISGTAYWASVVSPNTTFDPHRWEINVCNLSDETRAMVEEDGLPIKNKGDDRGDFVTIKRNLTRKDGGTNDAPKVVDSNNSPMHNTLIGNGSLVNVKYRPYSWSYSNRKGVSADLMAVQVVDLVEYMADGDFESVEGGYTSGEGSDIPFPTN
jgi:hypothetical protein